MANLIPRYTSSSQGPFVVIGTCDVAIRRTEAHASSLGAEESGTDMAHGQIAGEAMRWVRWSRGNNAPSIFDFLKLCRKGQAGC